MLPFNKLTLVIIAYNDDFKLLIRLLESIKTFCILDQIQSVTIVLNDFDKNLTSLREIANTFNDLPINLYKGSTLNPEIKAFNWNTQQTYKCVVADYVKTPWYMVLDCKDYFIEDVDLLNDCFTQDGKAYMPLKDKGGKMIPPFSAAHRIAHSIWNVDYKDYLERHLPNSTPFLIKTSLMKQMVTELDVGFYPFLFEIQLNGEQLITEFTLYSAYCASKNDLRDYAAIEKNTKFFEKFLQDKTLRTVTPSSGQDKIVKKIARGIEFPSMPKYDQEFTYNKERYKYTRNNKWIKIQ